MGCSEVLSEKGVVRERVGCMGRARVWGAVRCCERRV